MKHLNSPVTVDQLMAYVDGQLSVPEHAEMETYLAAQPEARSIVDRYRQQNSALHAAFDPVLDEPVPPQLLPAALGLTVVSSWPRSRPAVLAATLLLGTVLGGVLGGLGGWIARGVASAAPTQTLLVQQAATAHAVYTPEIRHPVEVGANEEAHLVAWLSKRLGQKVRAPDLKAQGFNLVGGRLLPATDGGRPSPAAQFMYEDSGGQRLTLYVRSKAGMLASGGETAFRYAKEGTVDVFYWIEGDAGYALSGTIGREPMLTVARAVYDELSKRE